ncbi:MAG: AI-2E family transporter [Rhodospirillales bacterium]|nr:AI-2E family transporter [Rhodospirillales bacterium]
MTRSDRPEGHPVHPSRVAALGAAGLRLLGAGRPSADTVPSKAPPTAPLAAPPGAPFAAPPPTPPPAGTPPAERPALPPGGPPVLLPSGGRGQRLALAIGLVVVAWLTLRLFAGVLAPFVAAAVIAYALDPPTTRLTRLGLPRGIAAMLMVVAMLACVLLFILLLYPLILSQVGLLLGRVPEYVQLVQQWASHVITDLQHRLGPDAVSSKLQDLVSSQAGNMLSFIASTVAGLITGGFALFNVLTLAIVTPVVAFYLLRDWPRMLTMIDGWLPLRARATIRAQAREVDRILSAWVRGQALCCVILGIYYALALTMAGLDLGLIVGMSAGVLSFIPYVGSITGGVAAIGLALAQFPTWSGVVRIVVVLVVGQLLENYLIYPRFLGDRVELPAVWVIFALFAGGAAFGFLGVMLAVPMAATIGVLARFWLRRYLRSDLYLDPPTD